MKAGAAKLTLHLFLKVPGSHGCVGVLMTHLSTESACEASAVLKQMLQSPCFDSGVSWLSAQSIERVGTLRGHGRGVLAAF